MVRSLISTTLAPNQTFGVDTTNGGPIDCYTLPGGAGPSLIPFSVSISEVSGAGQVVEASATIPELVGATFTGVDVIWPAATSPFPLALLDAAVSDPLTGEVTVRFLSTDFFPGASGQGLVLLVYP